MSRIVIGVVLLLGFIARADENPSLSPMPAIGFAAPLAYRAPVKKRDTYWWVIFPAIGGATLTALGAVGIYDWKTHPPNFGGFGDGAGGYAGLTVSSDSFPGRRR